MSGAFIADATLTWRSGIDRKLAGHRTFIRVQNSRTAASRQIYQAEPVWWHVAGHLQPTQQHSDN